MSKQIVAVHYRLSKEADPGLQGCWKEFGTIQEATAWLDQRTRKTDTSPQGRFICRADRAGIAFLEAVLVDTWNPYQYPESLKAAVVNYLKWKRANHGSNPSLF